ncbi:Protein MAIN-LIKE 1 [Glycine soja]
MVDVVAGAETNTQDTDAQDIGDEPEGFPGGPRDPSVLTEYADHVAASVWSRQERPELKLSSHGRKVHHLGKPIPTIEDMRWHRETSSFHLPVGEISITLDDVETILHLPIVGTLHDFQALCTDEAVLLLVELLVVSPEVSIAETGQCGEPYALRDLTLVGRYAWGAIGLVHMYDQLNDASLSTSRQLAGYITLLQCWIYEHFPSAAECNVDSDYDEVSPRACRWITTKKTVKKVSTATYRQHLDRLRIPDVCWMPYSEHRPVQDFHPISCFSRLVHWGPIVVRYRPKRVMRQFGYFQCTHAHHIHQWVSYDDIDDTWTHYLDHLATAGDLCVVSGQCAPDYIDWFDVDEPRHAVACDAITERLERHLSLEVVTPGTSTHVVIKECLVITRSVTRDRIVYVSARKNSEEDELSGSLSALLQVIKRTASAHPLSERRSSRERKVQVPKSSERFCCVKICRDASSKQKPFREHEMSLRFLAYGKLNPLLDLPLNNKLDGLYEENPSRLVALGRLYEGSTTIHNIPLLHVQVKVGVEEVKDAEALVPVPTNEVTLVGQTLNTFLAWPTHLVKRLSEQAAVSPAKPPESPDEEVDDPLYLMTLTIPQLFLKLLQVMWDATIFGVFNQNFPLYIKHEDLSEIAHGGQCLSISVIQLWILHLTETSVRARNSMDSLSHSPFRDLDNHNLNMKVEILILGTDVVQDYYRAGCQDIVSDIVDPAASLLHLTFILNCTATPVFSGRMSGHLELNTNKSYIKSWIQSSKRDVYLGAYLNGPDNYLKGIINSALKGLDDTPQPNPRLLLGGLLLRNNWETYFNDVRPLEAERFKALRIQWAQYYLKVRNQT